MICTLVGLRLESEHGSSPPAADPLAPFVGSVEITAGTLVLLGLGTRRAAIPLIAIMCVALASTKVPILLARGFWAAAHESRTDWPMLLGSLFLLVEGGGRWSLDATRSDQHPLR